MEEIEKNRRPTEARSANWAQKSAQFLASTNISPNQISVISELFAAIGAGLLMMYPTTA